MGDTTDFVGRIQVTPPLNASELRHLAALGTGDVDAAGSSLTFQGAVELDRAGPWLRQVIRQFLKTGAAASRSGHRRFQDFTFDHRLDGMVVGSRRDSGELVAISVNDNRVTTRVLRRGALSSADQPSPTCATAASQKRRARAGPQQMAVVIDLNSRRPTA